MKQFITAVKEDEKEGTEEENKLQFDLDGFIVTAYKPGSGQLGYLFASTGQQADNAQKVAGLINFFNSCLDEESSRHIINRLMDRKDPFDHDKVDEILEHMSEEWGARPTQ